MENKKKSLLQSEKFNSIAASIMAIIVGLAFGCLVMLITEPGL